MANTDPYIRIITVIFTPVSTMIASSMTSLSGPHLKIQIFPTYNGKDIDSIKFWYFNNDAIPSRLNEEITEDNVFNSLVNSMKGEGNNLVDKASSYMKSLPADEIAVIVREYTKYIENGTILDGFLAGIASYLSFLLLNENNIFMNQMPFQFGVPFIIRSGTTVNHNMFQHLSLPLTSLARVSQGILLQLVLFIQSFINIWDPMFHNGPDIGFSNEARMSMEILSGFSQHVSLSLAQTRALNESMAQNLQSIESRLQSYLDDILIKMKREINNLQIDIKKSIKEITLQANSQFSNIDEVIKQRIGAIVKDDLESQIKSMIQMEIEACHERINELIRWYAEEHIKKLALTITIDRENEIKGLITGLEHRIEILYSKLDSNSLENITYIKSHNGNNTDISNYTQFSTEFKELTEFTKFTEFTSPELISPIVDPPVESTENIFKPSVQSTFEDAPDIIQTDTEPNSFSIQSNNDNIRSTGEETPIRSNVDSNITTIKSNNDNIRSTGEETPIRSNVDSNITTIKSAQELERISIERINRPTADVKREPSNFTTYRGDSPTPLSNDENNTTNTSNRLYKETEHNQWIDIGRPIEGTNVSINPVERGIITGRRHLNAPIRINPTVQTVTRDIKSETQITDAEPTEVKGKSTGTLIPWTRNRFVN